MARYSRILPIALALAWPWLMASAAMAADISAREVAEALFKSAQDAPADLSDRSLAGLDLAGLDFKGARLTGSDLFGADLTRTRLNGANLEGAKLDRATVSYTDFSGAKMKGATLRSLTVFSDLEPNPREAPRFKGTDLSGAEIIARLDGADFRGANLTGARIKPQPPSWGAFIPRAVLVGADFSSANLTRLEVRKAVLRFARFVDADLSGADFRDCDLSGADFSGAELAGADFTGTNLDGAIFHGAKGFDRAKGLADAVNAERTIR